MIDTVYIYQKLSKKDYNKTYEQVASISRKMGSILRTKKTNSQIDKVYGTNCLCEKGFLEINFHTTMQKNGFYRRQIEIKLKPKLLIDPQNYSDVTTSAELGQIRKEFNKIINQINPSLPDFWDWKCKRVDYAVIIYNEYVEEYIELLKMGYVWDKFRKEADKIHDYDGSLYLKSESNNVIINFYDKYNQLVDTNHCLGKEENYEQAENKLRLEVQCMGQKIQNIKGQYNLDSSTVKDLLQPHISKDIIKYYYKMIAGKQNYYNLKKAFKKLNINKQNLKYPVIEYISVLSEIKAHGSIWKAMVNSLLGESAFVKRIREIEEIGINPVLIPDEWNIRRLPNLRSQIIVI